MELFCKINDNWEHDHIFSKYANCILPICKRGRIKYCKEDTSLWKYFNWKFEYRQLGKAWRSRAAQSIESFERCRDPELLRASKCILLSLTASNYLQEPCISFTRKWPQLEPLNRKRRPSQRMGKQLNWISSETFNLPPEDGCSWGMLKTGNHRVIGRLNNLQIVYCCQWLAWHGIWLFVAVLKMQAQWLSSASQFLL